MYPSKGSSSYGQQLYNTQQGYAQLAGTSYSGTPVGGSDVAGQHALASHQQSLLVAPQESDLSSYRTHSSQASQYGSPYAAAYASSTLGTQQAGGFSAKVPGSSSLQGRTSYASALADSSKFSSGALGSSLAMSNEGYVSASSLGYTQKGDQFPAAKGSDYTMDRRLYIDHQGAYIGRDLQNDSSRRYTDSLPISHLSKSEIHDHADQASLIRQQQGLNAQSLQAGADARQADYFAATAGPVRHGLQEFNSYSGRVDVNPRSSSILGSSPYVGQHSSSILGGASRRNVDEHTYPQGSSTAGYGVSLPPGRDYVAGKGLHGPSVESDYQGSVLSRGHSSIGVSMINERKDDRDGLRREFEIREEERRRELMRERERERDRERERERERERDREREKERERIRILERRERERERDRERERERREKERERERKREADARRVRTPPKAAREHRASSSAANERSVQRVTPRREMLHRHGSPVKEKRREYVCKVHPFCLVDAERDYLSLSKRYPKLSISPEFSKVMLLWPKKTLNISLYTPVSFEHDFVEVDNKDAEKEIPSVDVLPKFECSNITWNAKVILMSGVSSGALEGLCSEKTPVDRAIHMKNILKFAVLKKEQSFLAIGGPWSASIDGGDPSVDESSLIRTAIRCVKEIIQLDLHNCVQWNRFLEIHYHRIGKDGFFSHKEITVLFVPNLSNCLPSVDIWRTQWLAYKKDIAEREQPLSLKQEKKSSKENLQGDQKANKSKNVDNSGRKVKTEDTQGKVEEKEGLEGVILDKTPDMKTPAEKKGKGPAVDEKQIEKKNLDVEVGDGKNNGSQSQDGALTTSVTDVQKTTKKKVIRKIVKGKTIAKKSPVGGKMDVKHEVEKQGNQETAIHENEISVDNVNANTSVLKKTVKNDSAAKSPQKDDMAVDTSTMQTEIKADIESELQNDKAMGQKPEGTAVTQETVVKMAGKKKVIRRVVKRKVAKKELKDGNSIAIELEKVDNVTPEKVVEGDGLKIRDGKKDDLVVIKSENEITEVPKLATGEKCKASEAKAKSEKEDIKQSIGGDKRPRAGKKDSNSSSNSKNVEGKDSKKDGQNNDRKDEKEKKSNDTKQDAKQKTSKEIKGKKSEEPPKHPGFFLRMKRTRGSKLRSVSLSLDGLLEYTEKDTQESTFELSLFAETLNEMLQYEMGCRLLGFLEKLRKKFVMKIHQRKRERDEKTENGSEKEKSPLKRLKIDKESPQENEPKSSIQGAPDLNADEKVGDDATAVSADTSKMENRTDGDDNEDDGDEDIEDEDPEEFFEDEQEVDGADDIPQEDVAQDENSNLEGKLEKTDTIQDTNKKAEDPKNSGGNGKVDNKIGSPKKEDKEVCSKNKLDLEKHDFVDKELLQAFRFFDQNQVGYIKVEDLRCILHNLGKFLTYKDVKELVQSALIESNSAARDNRIIYRKLVRLRDI
ncbi:protein SHORT ROOT IN SALT MEDIUM 1 isoform X1 [Dioscorea cayenensis subsp. rotundata]|uniref:Protein SHORT ROOT IN SALT MEDIUM 1 isoform X1 n=1 Tax=Dioscorea cayennensis subsp. rotundata TaxID=55577 RepID=A0AB40C910_DIOCR|nr:protein SHORT ROOT IN SALT MEDIUM 1 isoform X1 [Dioscorea cayenensis subsp. rotundata]XP_039136316.1 protein SHORT ROOT IN SALT MEDIUM 1 isoform X1 [Dioscorea cayenensis subsp. rotundata]